MKKSSLAPLLLLRLGFTAVFAWFAGSQIANPTMWADLIPSWLTHLTGISATAIVLTNATAEFVLALLLALNIFVPIVAGLLALHLATIVIDLGLNSIGIRDMGLMISLVALALLAWEESASG